jgi:hypothetical protein
MRWRWPFFTRNTASTRAMRNEWMRLPPLRLTVRPDPPVLAPLLRPPSVATTQSLIHRPFPRGSGIGRPIRGSVAGLVRSARLPVPEPPPQPVVDGPVGPEPLPPRPAPVITTSTPREPLTEAVDAYVGEPTEPAMPYRTSSFNRLLAQFDGAPDGLAQAAMLALGGLSSEASPPPIRTPDSPEEYVPPPAMTRHRVMRRPTLAQSRRMGLAGPRPTEPTQPEPPTRSDAGPVAAQEPTPNEEPVPKERLAPKEEPVPSAEPVVDRESGAHPRMRSAPRARADSPPAPLDVPPAPDGPSPERSAPDWAAPDRATSEQAAPEQAAPNRATPDHTAPDRAAPERSAPARRPGIGPPLPGRPALDRRPHGEPPNEQADRPTDRLQPPATPTHATRPPLPDAARQESGEAVARQSVTPRPPAIDGSPPGPAPSVEPAPVVYRAALEPLPPSGPQAPPSARHDAMRTEAVPVDVADRFRNRFGVDVSAVPVHRGPAVTTLARAASARAFTRHGEVFVPDVAGELTAPDGRALLVHELVHAAQQRALGANLPDERSAGGMLLEATATSAERWDRGHGDGPGALVHPPLRLSPAPPPTPQPPVQRAGEDDSVSSVDLAALLSATPADETTPVRPATVDVSAPRSIGAAAGPVVVTTPPVVETAIDLAAVDVLRGRVDQLANTVEELGANAQQPNDRRQFDDLARRLYHRIRDNLRQELIIDRERAGLLSDLR